MRFLVILVSVLAPLAGQDFVDIKVEKVASGYRFTEGPLWSRDGFLLFSDIPNNRILQFAPGTKTGVFREQSNGANGNAYDTQGRLYTCESSARRVTRTGERGRIEVLADKYQGKRFNAPNDIVVRKDGNAWFTDPAFAGQDDTRELDFFGVYHLNVRGQVDLAVKSSGRPNGIDLSPNGRVLYVADSDERKVRAYDLDRGGKLSGERVLITGTDGVPDGICTDEKGNIYVACNKIAVYSADGRRLAAIEIPETPSNCAFGDADFQGLYVTARTSVYRVRLNVKGAIPY